jgi:hypothetical protein
VSGGVDPVTVSTGCPRPGCEGEIESDVQGDGDDSGRRWVQAEARSDRCSEGHELTADEWERVLPEADRKAAEWEPSEWWE